MQHQEHENKSYYTTLYIFIYISCGPWVKMIQHRSWKHLIWKDDTGGDKTVAGGREKS